ncbi:MAG: hypothetical protein ABIP65_00445, partial [Vicinamibacterales bacterium]
RADGRLWERIPVMLAMFVAMALLHLQYSQPRAFWLFRYEAYLVGVGVIVVSAALFDRRYLFQSASRVTVKRVALVGMLLLIISPLTDRAVKSAARVPGASANIYEQQYQMGRFLREYYPGAPTALNDIGAPAYLAKVKVLDLVGLASMEVARLRRERRFSPGAIEELARAQNVRLAIVYDGWFRGSLPRSWVRAGSWRIRNPVVVGGDTVTFYATHGDEYAALVAHLLEFEPSLPAGVTAVIGR